MLIDTDDVNSLEKLGLAIFKIPSVVIAFTKIAVTIEESREIIIDTVLESPKFRRDVENAFLTSELRPVQRISTVETVLGLNDFSDLEDEDRSPSLPERISLLEEKLPELQGTPIKHSDNIPTSKTEIRACKLVERLKQARDSVGGKFLSSAEIVGFLRNGLEDALKVKDGQNVRQIKKEVLEKAAKMFPDVRINQKSTGRRDLRLVLKT
jgi:hypothetical protein